MATAKQIEANRRNALKSTGPKTSAGKARSSKNALKHGLTSAALVLENESADELRMQVDAWKTDLKPRTVAERTLVTRAAESCWRLNRCFRAEQAKYDLVARHARQGYEMQQLRRAHDLGRSLIDDPVNRCLVPRDDKDMREALAAWNHVEPALVVKELESFAQGADWLIDRYQELGTILETEGFWHYPEKFLAIRLLGKRPEDALRDREIAKIFMACRALHPEPWDATADFQQAALGQKGRPVYAVRVEFLEKHENISKEQALNDLRVMVRSRIADLQSLKDETLDEIDQLDRDAAIETALLEMNRTMELAVRYESAREREVARSMNLYLKLRKLEVGQPEEAPSEPSSKPLTKAKARSTSKSPVTPPPTPKPTPTLNPTPGPAPTPSPTVKPSPTPTPTQASTAIVTPKPKPAPVPQPKPAIESLNRPAAVEKPIRFSPIVQPNIDDAELALRPIVLRGNRKKKPLELMKQETKPAQTMKSPQAARSPKIEQKPAPRTAPLRDRLKRPTVSHPRSR